MTNSNQQSKFFNLTTTGVGYANRIRKIPLRKGHALAVTFDAKRGEADENGKVATTTIELYVRGSEAIKHIQNLLDNGYDPLKDKVYASFEIGDIQPDVNEKDGSPKSYVRKDGTHKVVLRGNLLRIKFMMLNGEYVVHLQKPAESAAPSHDETSDKASAPASEVAASDFEAQSEEAVA